MENEASGIVSSQIPAAHPLGVGGRLYLDLMKKCLSGYLFGQKWRPLEPSKWSLKWMAYEPLSRLLAIAKLQLVRQQPFNAARRAEGGDWPTYGETMIGLRRLDNLEACISDVVHRNIPGDLIETGVWRGGAVIFMRAVLKVLGDSTRTVWAADSFQGLPKPYAKHYPADEGSDLHTFRYLSVTLEEVKANFERYGMLDKQVQFLVGWFKDTLPAAPIRQLSILRLDGDLYESTMEALRALYSKVSVGGYVIVDDYGVMPSCKAAVEDFRKAQSITEDIRQIDWSGIYWQRLR